DEDRQNTGTDQTVEDRQPEVRWPPREEGGRCAVHTEAKEHRVAERYHTRVADQDVERHRQQPPDQNLGYEAPPELWQHERRDGEERQDEAKANPVTDGTRTRCHHFGVGTNRPVGLKRSVRISTTKETMTAWAGLTQIEANASSMLMKIDARIEPPRLPMPPTTTTMNAFSMKSSPMAWFTPTSGPKRTPLAAAMAAPTANTIVCTSGTGMPIA